MVYFKFLIINKNTKLLRGVFLAYIWCNITQKNTFFSAFIKEAKEIMNY